MEANESLAYIAGILDGEGTIGVSVSRRGHCSLYAKISNTNREVIDYVDVLLPGSISEKKENNRCKVCYTLSWHGQDAVDVIELLLPYLIIKRSVANVALEFWVECLAYRPITRIIGEAELILRMSYKGRINNLNRRGVD